MKTPMVSAAIAGMLWFAAPGPARLVAQASAGEAAKASPVPRMTDGHPDLS